MRLTIRHNAHEVAVIDLVSEDEVEIELQDRYTLGITGDGRTLTWASDGEEIDLHADNFDALASDPQCRFCGRYPGAGATETDAADRTLVDPNWDGDGDICTDCLEDLQDGPLAPGYSWHPSRDGFGTLLETEAQPGGGYLVVHNGIRFEEAIARYGEGNVERYSSPLPITTEVER